jgi:hypothetical protein
MLSLRELQTCFFRSLTRAPEGGSASFDPRLVRCVEGRGQLGPEQRIDIYAQMYYARLREVLREDFPCVAAVLGCAGFDTVVRAYLADRPSTHPSLRHLGCQFAAFLDTRAETGSLPFLGDLARLEWARLDVFDAPASEPLQVEHLQHIAPEEWPGLRFRLTPACQILHSDWPVHELWATAEKGTPGCECVRREKTTLRVWRDGFAVYHATMDAIEHTALVRVLAGDPFSAVCGAVESLLPAEVAAAVGSLLLRWIEDGLLARLPQE